MSVLTPSGPNDCLIILEPRDETSLLLTANETPWRKTPAFGEQAPLNSFKLEFVDPQGADFRFEG
jgi:hypothetical protein